MRTRPARPPSARPGAAPLRRRVDGGELLGGPAAGAKATRLGAPLEPGSGAPARPADAGAGVAAAPAAPPRSPLAGARAAGVRAPAAPPCDAALRRARPRSLPAALQHRPQEGGGG